MTASQGANTLEADVVIVGAGFSGIYLLHRLRDQLGLNTKIFEAGSDLGGVWNSNIYPGARLDSGTPFYGFGIEEVYKSWTWSQAYPAQPELREYFEHVDRVLSIRKDCIFNSRVIAASFDPDQAKWTIKTEDGKTAVAKYLIPAIGFAEQEYIPPWKGLDSFEGAIHHSSKWPQKGVEVKNKRVAVIGTGATGIQIIQEWAKEAAELVVFQRTPNFALPMPQKELDPEAQRQMAEDTTNIFEKCRKTPNGMPQPPPTKAFADFTPEEADRIVNHLYDIKGFGLWAGAYIDLLINPEANRFTYDVWAKRTRARIEDPVKRDLLAPLEPPHPFGTKRPSLENGYYEEFNRPNVHLVDVNSHAIQELTAKGIVTDDGHLYEVDAIAIATGFNSTTGGLFKMGIRDTNGVDLEQRWKDGVLTYLGMTVPGFPNMFLPYCVQAPTPLTSGPVFIELQADIIRDLVKKMESEGIRSLEPCETAAQAWRAEILAIGDMTLFPKAKSWYRGANIPGKPVEILYYFAGIPRYLDSCREALGHKFSESFTCH
ncbi:hypothetical protein PENDEC_c020G02735 [Penicillium decumbens]|uniref:FAD/NAD(P)-binding domain-containing protein n=1 Tax=Penicillium decumbens TaxID=69771 RepID=A0A1V6P6R2_PENDC|nr:hypothetical protein PENDEC_c020G02735 [Penicillium decumbens]